MAKTIDLTPKFPLSSFAEQTEIEVPISFADFLGEQSMNVPTIIRQNQIQSANFKLDTLGWKLNARGVLEGAMSPTRMWFYSCFESFDNHMYYWFSADCIPH